MIPADLASRLRMLTEASFFSGEPTVAPLARVKAISEQLPAFVPGQRIVATLQTAQPGNTYRARIADHDFTLALPQAANAGDTLELVVSHVTPRAVFATLAEPTAAPGTGSATAPALSQAGRLISFLLTGQPAAQTAALNGGQPMLASAPQASGDSVVLANRLGAALGQSGLFYESHQARWLAGKLDTAALLQEPQNRSAPTLPAQPAEGSAATAARGLTEGLAPIPERLLPVVHQQLDAPLLLLAARKPLPAAIDPVEAATPAAVPIQKRQPPAHAVNGRRGDRSIQHRGEFAAYVTCGARDPGLPGLARRIADLA